MVIKKAFVSILFKLLKYYLAVQTILISIKMVDEKIANNFDTLVNEINESEQFSIFHMNKKGKQIFVDLWGHFESHGSRQLTNDVCFDAIKIKAIEEGESTSFQCTLCMARTSIKSPGCHFVLTDYKQVVAKMIELKDKPVSKVKCSII